MESIEYQSFRASVCDRPGCWTEVLPAEAGVSVDQGSGWMFFRIEHHFHSQRCVGRSGRIGKICDAVAVPRQKSRNTLIFVEMKYSGKSAAALEQIRAGVTAVLQYGIPADAKLRAEIWHRRRPKSTMRPGRYISVGGRRIQVRHRLSL